MEKGIKVRNETAPMNVFGSMDDFERSFEKMFERFFSNRSSMLADWPVMASKRSEVTLQEDDDNYLVSANLPGIPAEDIEVKVAGNCLTIRAEHGEESGREDEERGYRSQYQSYFQSLLLPSEIDADKIEAECSNGRLEILMPKTEKAQGKKIQVQAGKGGLFHRLADKGVEKAKSLAGKRH